MPTFEELLATLHDPGEDGPPETIYDDLTAAHTGALEGANAKIAELTTSNEAANAENQRLQARNWELFEQIPKAGDSEGEEPREEETLDGEDLDLDSLIIDPE